MQTFSQIQENLKAKQIKDLKINPAAKQKMDPANIEQEGWQAPEQTPSNWVSNKFIIEEPVAPGQEIKFEFKYTGKKQILNTKASCGCTSVKTDDERVEGKIAVAKDFSFAKEQLVKQTKTVVVNYVDNTSDILTISYTVDKSKDVE